MDNLSRRHSKEDTTTSMYLSFDAESTMSTACYRTLDAMSDMSVLSGYGSSIVDQNKTGDTTLEIHENSDNISPLKTVKKIEIPDSLPLRGLSKNILKEYKALCSTPSKEQLMKTVDMTRGSDATRCVDLGLAFLGVDDEKPAYFPPPPEYLHDDNKENALPENEVSFSTCSSVEITTSVIEKKMLPSISTVASITEEESLEEAKMIKTMAKDTASVDITDKSANAYSLVYNDSVHQIGNRTTNSTDFKKDVETLKAKDEDMEYGDIIKESTETQGENAPFDLGIAKENLNKKLPVKPKTAVLARNVRRSICEPNLQSNKPSVIYNSHNKRRSLLPTSTKSTACMDAEIEIPLLMNKMLKITNTTVETKELNTLKEKKKVNGQQYSSPADKRRSNISSMKTRSSLIPSVPGNKRPFNFTQRMSVVVKTTLNSPARKIARKSSMSGAMSSLQRRSVIPQKITTTGNSSAKNSQILPHKMMVSNSCGININTQANSKTLSLLKETSTKLTSPQRKYIYPSSKVLEKGDLSHSKRDILYACNVCKEKFRIKSLLDAHKRSHESDNIAPAFIKKPSTITQSGTTIENSNQCKHCDKKFALLRALHIHLLQNCLKIPPSEKRKLQYTDLNHVEKAQLPNVFSHHSVQSSASSTVSSVSNAPRYTLQQKNITTRLKSSTELLTENKDIQKMTSNLATNINGSNVTESHTTVHKKITAHTGVYKTPSKTVPCHLCKLTFKSILDYTNHNLTTHNSRKEDDTNETLFKKNISPNN